MLVAIAAGLFVVVSGTLLEKSLRGSCQREVADSSYQSGHSSIRWTPPSVRCERSSLTIGQNVVSGAHDDESAAYAIVAVSVLLLAIAGVAGLLYWIVIRAAEQVT